VSNSADSFANSLDTPTGKTRTPKQKAAKKTTPSDNLLRGAAAFFGDPTSSGPTPKAAPKGNPLVRIRKVLQQANNDGLLERYAKEMSTGGQEAKLELHTRATKAGLDPRIIDAHAIRALRTANREWSKSLPKHPPNILDRTAKNFVDAAYGMPGGIKNLGQAVVYDVKDAPGQVARGKLGQLLKHDRTLGKQIGVGMAQDVRHPLRNPGNTILDAWALASIGGGTASRVSAAGRAETLAGTAKALVKKPKIVPREANVGGVVIKSEASGNTFARMFQGAYDKMIEAHPGSRVAQKRVGKELWHEQRFVENVSRALPGAVEAAGKKLSSAQKRAIQAVAEGQPIGARITHLTENAKSASTVAEVGSATAELKLLRAAKRYVVEVDGKPTLAPAFRRSLITKIRRGAKPADLQAAYEIGGKAAAKETAIKVDKSLISDETAANRIQMPGRKIADEQLRSAGVGGQQTFWEPTFMGGEFRVTHVQRGGVSRLKADVQGYRGGLPQKMKSVTNPFTGKLLETGNLTPNVTRSISQSLMEAERYGTKDWLRGRLVEAGQKFSPETLPDNAAKDWQAIRLDSTASIPPRVKTLMDRRELGTQLTRAEQKEIAAYSVEHDAEMFPNVNDLKTPEDYQGVVFVPKNMTSLISSTAGTLGAGMGSSVARALAGFMKGVNQIERAGILFTSPKYIITNAPQNFFFNIIQQKGNVASAARDYIWAVKKSSKVLGPEGTAMIDAVGGEGKMASGLAGTPGQFISGVTGKVAEAFGKPTDIPNRRVAIRYEARREGFKTTAKLKDLLLNPANREALYRVSRRANDAIIDYSRLGKFEQVITNFVFFYPWVKGASRYTKHFVVEHPVQAAAYAKLGQQSTDETTRLLGPLPDYLKGVFVAGHRGNTPKVINPTSLGFANTPMDIAESLVNLAKGKTDTSQNVLGNMTPAYSALMALVTHQTGSGYSYPANNGSLSHQVGQQVGILKDQLYSGLPLIRMKLRLQGQQSKLYPMNKQDMLLQGIMGSWFPKPINELQGNTQAATQNRAGMDSADKIKTTVADEKRNMQIAISVAGGQYPPILDKAFEARQEHLLALQPLPKGTTEVNRFKAELNLLLAKPQLRQGVAPAQIKKWLRLKLTDEQAKKARSELNSAGFWGGAAISEVNSELKIAGFTGP